jgi:hypothetical protein
MMPLRLIAILPATLLFAGCDPLALGYVNRLSHRVTVVERGRALTAPLHLKAGESRAPGFGTTAESIDVLDTHGRLLAHYRIRDIPRAAGRGRIRYVVITPHGPEMELKEHLAYDE